MRGGVMSKPTCDGCARLTRERDEAVKRAMRAEKTAQHYEALLVLPDGRPYCVKDGLPAKDVSPLKIADLIRRAEAAEGKLSDLRDALYEATLTDGDEHEMVSALRARAEAAEVNLAEIELCVFDLNGLVKVPRGEITKWLHNREAWWHKECCKAREAGHAEQASALAAMREAAYEAVRAWREKGGRE
jgi:hypothetical protein